MNKALLEKLKIAVVVSVSRECIDADAKWVENWLTGALIMKVHGYVWAEEESAKRQEVTYPDGWWQAFKMQWFPAWARGRWPVRLRRVVLDVRALYPEFRPAISGETVRLRINREEKITMQIRDKEEEDG